MLNGTRTTRFRGVLSNRASAAYGRVTDVQGVVGKQNLSQPTAGVSISLLGLSLALWFSAIALVPFYFGRSGTLQVADLLFLSAAVVLVFRGVRLKERAGRSVVLVFFFVSYVIVVNLVWSLLLAQRFSWDDLPLGSIPFYVFNAIVVATGLTLASSDPVRLVRTTRSALGVALAANVVAISLIGLGGGRATLFFNNPNQLGYFAVLASCIFLLTSSRATRLVDLAALTTALVLAAASLSKGAMVAILVAGIIALLRGRWLVMAGVLALTFALTSLPFGSDLLDRALLRIEGIGQDADDNPAGRGYDRILNHPELLVLGAGEGAHERFGSRIEFHSSLGTLVFAYGIVGATLFFFFLWTAWRQNGIWVWLVSSPIWLYGLTHQGLRTRLFWVFIVMGYAVHGWIQSRSANQRRE